MNDNTIAKLNNILNTYSEKKIKENNDRDRNFIYNAITTLEDIIGFDEDQTLEERTMLRAKWIAEYPDQEWWDTALCEDEFGDIVHMDFKISTKGNIVICMLEESRITLTVNYNTDYLKYECNIVKELMGDNFSVFALDRMMADMFLPVPDHLKKKKKLVVAHKDGRTGNNELTNLEWEEENEIGPFKNVLLRDYDDTHLKGYVFHSGRRLNRPDCLSVKISLDTVQKKPLLMPAEFYREKHIFHKRLIHVV